MKEGHKDAITCQTPWLQPGVQGTQQHEVITPRILTDTDRWFVIRTLSRQEKALAEALAARGIQYFLPLQRAVRYYGRRKVYAELPLFACYLFLHGQVEDAYFAERSGRATQILRVADQKRLDSDLANIRLALERGASLAPHPWVTDGIVAEVVSGPFRGIRGAVRRSARHDRLVLQIEAIGGASQLEIDSSLLAPVVEDTLR